MIKSKDVIFSLHYNDVLGQDHWSINLEMHEDAKGNEFYKVVKSGLEEVDLLETTCYTKASEKLKDYFIDGL